MLYAYLFVAALAVTFCSPAEAIEQPPSQPPISADLSAGAAAGAAAGAVSGSKSSSEATGVGIGGSASGGSATGGSAAGGSASANGKQQQAQQMGQGQSSSIVNEGDTSRAKSLALFLPPPSFTPPMAKVECAGAMIEQSAGSLFWSGATWAHAKTDSSDCTLINIRNAKIETCQYASAKQIEDLIVARHLPSFVANTDARFIDYSPEQCAVLKAPPKPAEPQISFVEVEKVVEKIVEVDRPCPQGWKRNTRGVCYDPAWIDEAKRLRECAVCNRK